MTEYKTINSFNQTPSLGQIVAILLYGLQISTFYGITQRRISSKPAFISLHILYGISILGQLVSTFISSYIDPSDQLMIQYRNNREEYV